MARQASASGRSCCASRAGCDGPAIHPLSTNLLFATSFRGGGARETAAAIGGDRLGIRLSPYGVNGGMAAYPEFEETCLTLLGLLADAGLAYVHVADHVAMGAPAVPTAFKQALRKAWPRTFFIGGSLDLASGQQAVDSFLSAEVQRRYWERWNEDNKEALDALFGAC